MNDWITALSALGLVLSPALLKLAEASGSGGSDDEEPELLCVVGNKPAPVHRKFKGHNDIDTHLDPGSVAHVLGERGGWSKAVYVEGDRAEVGWIAGGYLGACEEDSGADTAEFFKIATWNIQNFGKAKANDPDRLEIIVQTIEQFDLVAIQEVSDKTEEAPATLLAALNADGPQYAMLLSPRSGEQDDDTLSQEQYLFLYKTDLFAPLGEPMLFDDANDDAFQREPWLARFRVVGSDFDFALITVHTAPNAAVAEIGALHDVVQWARTELADEDAFVVLGDYNAGCNYAKPADLDQLDFRGDDYLWIVPDSAETNVAAKKCAYDRIVVTGPASEHFADEWQVEPGNVTKEISDHYPVWAKFTE